MGAIVRVRRRDALWLSSADSRPSRPRPERGGSGGERIFAEAKVSLVSGLRGSDREGCAGREHPAV
jgi:hypothetical protein